MSIYNQEHEKRIHLLPYNEEYCPEGTLSYIAAGLKNPKITRLLWSDGTVMTTEQLIRYFSPTENRILFLCLYVPENMRPGVEHTMGIIWIDDIHMAVRANAHFAFWPDYWGEGRPQIACMKALHAFFSPPLDLKTIICVMNHDNRYGRRLMSKLGAQILGTVPDYYKHGENYMDAVVGYISRERWLEENREFVGRNFSLGCA